ncbi:uncharacterized protein LOC113864558 isoform X2 [Abrus precatorius]|uniref:Uncharacterized protein LOC113864558 isoform X2 n=1 Tax=Abrus precatorius TaxID=3816 RepID=A0A8B8LHG0_ABRPR|nr:uncharacterized protein LOC113864558 isoform X2 [Abrus precatorius]
MGPPPVTSLGDSLTSTDQKQKMVRKKKQGNVVEHEGPDFSIDNSASEAGVTIKHPLRESAALPSLLSCQTIVVCDSTKKNGESKRKKTEHNAVESNVNDCSAPENTFSSRSSTSGLDMPSEHPIQCVLIDSVARQSCVDEGICQGHHEENEQNMINKTAGNSCGQCDVQKGSCNHDSVVTNPEHFAKESVLEVVKLNIEQGINDNSSNPEDKNGIVKNTSLVRKNYHYPAVYDISDKKQCVKTYSRRKPVNSNCRRSSGHPSLENCNNEPTMQDHHGDDSYKFSDGPLTVGLMDRETKLSNDEVTYQSGAATEEMNLRTDNTCEQRFMTTSSVVDIPAPGEQLETSGGQLDHTEITRNDLCCAGDVSDLSSVKVKDGHSKISQFLLDRTVASNTKNKLLILDVNGLLADFVSDTGRRYGPEPEPDFWLKRRKVYKRPFCDDFLQFCFDKFHVGIWSSRAKRNVDEAIEFLIGKSASKLLFCWSHCTITEFTTVENRNKPLVLKELVKLWEKSEPGLPWEKGEFNESNTLLLDDSPYKALVNPRHTAIFPYSYRYYDTTDSSLGPEGDLRVYLEGLAMADNVQEYVSANPFGQRPIRETNPSWGYYRKVIEAVKTAKMLARHSSPGREPTANRTMHNEKC